ncbi:MAG: 6,7-dimethyl-8-ribityllumazine synthase [Candidatus Magasanikbacteria bacterium CG11_big_fil_rev_8_21_14_0_20_39_34]|uniref:6,7-dimethyl-8-ribityllumazine synthase n=1 Tax=Candidatus Magasanikbacteria bacterium CG11_big_fil_rev_8_21_14_0_20_39_34 TaxID=1974653 RepID=A0A2H0N430_9BACT|nr:MAG: 6,7-dimethyl-8-ribityllumazine synthase [Candidatus Magasanikbacteria bacterium CG11_big_fil_rev_8_21_14_0_20_39_34]
MGKEAKFDTLDGSNVKVGIVAARWNDKYTYSLVEGCRESLVECNVKAENITGIFVPGAYEVPLGAKHLLDTTDVDVVVAVGCLIKGATMHFEYICEAVSQGIMRLNLDYGKPVIFGILTCLNEEQAQERSIGEHNHGIGWGKTAVEMVLLQQKKIGM